MSTIGIAILTGIGCAVLDGLLDLVELFIYLKRAKP